MIKLNKLEFAREKARIEAEFAALAAFERSLGREQPVKDAAQVMRGRYPQWAHLFKDGGEEK